MVAPIKTLYIYNACFLTGISLYHAEARTLPAVCNSEKRFFSFRNVNTEILVRFFSRPGIIHDFVITYNITVIEHSLSFISIRITIFSVVIACITYIIMLQSFNIILSKLSNDLSCRGIRKKD